MTQAWAAFGSTRGAAREANRAADYMDAASKVHILGTGWAEGNGYGFWVAPSQTPPTFEATGRLTFAGRELSVEVKEQTGLVHTQFKGATRRGDGGAPIAATSFNPST